MSLVDYEMAERTSELISEYRQKNELIPDYIFRNLIIAIISLTLNHEKLGPNVEKLYHDLEAEYWCGATQFYKEFQEIKRTNESLTK